MSSAKREGNVEMDEDLEMLRQAALQTLGRNRDRQKGNPTQNRSTSQRIKTNGNLIEIQPTELGSVAGGEGDYIVEEFVLEGSDASINSSDCDEVIEEVIVSDVEDDAVVDGPPVPNVRENEESRNFKGRSRSRSRSRSLSSHRSSESDAVSIKSSYSLIDDLNEKDNEFQSVEAKFLSRKAQKQNVGTESAAPSGEDAANLSRRRRSRSPAFRSRTTRRSRSRDNRVVSNRKSKSRSRSPARRRPHSPPLGSFSRGMRRNYRTNSNERNQRRRRSRSLTARSPNRRQSNQSNRRPRSRSRSPVDSKPKPVSHAPKSPPEARPDKVEKGVKNVSSEEMERLEKRRRKFEGESEVAPSKKVIKIAKDEKSSSTKKSTKTKSSSESGVKATVLKEKVQTTVSKRSGSNDGSHKDATGSPPLHKNKNESNQSDSGRSPDIRDDQEDLRTRLIKKKLEKLQQTGGSVPPSSVVVSLGSQRIFSQALKNSQLLDSSSAASSSEVSNTKGSSKSSSIADVTSKSKKPKSEVAISSKSSSSSGIKKLSSSSGRSGSTSTSTKSSTSSSRSSGTKRVVSVTYS